MDGIRRSGLTVLFAAGVAAVGAGCSGNDGPHDGTHNIYFMGTVIDGVANTPLQSTDGKTPPYDISLVYGTTTVKGKVDATTGRYTLGPLPAWNDYGVIIDATNSGKSYRAFSSYNSGIAPPAPPATSQSANIYTADTTQSFDFDAYLFPTDIAAPDVTLAITETDQPASAMPTAAGMIRIQPTSLSTIQGKTGEVGLQVWANSEDLFAASINDAFTAGTYSLSGGKLVYGVNYGATVYGVDGYQLVNSMMTFQAGVTSSLNIPISPLTTTPLPAPMLVSTSGACHTNDAAVSTATPIATVTFTFNVTVADGSTSLGGDAEILDNGLYVLTSGSSTLKPNSSATVQEHGTSLVFSGNTLTIGWTPATGLATPGASDIVEEVEYESLSSMYIEQPNHPESRVSLGSLVATSGYILCGV
jgi:hypothetical protein